MYFDDELKSKKMLSKKEEKISISSIEASFTNIVSPVKQDQQIGNYPPKNIDELVDYIPTIETMKSIKYNFLEEHRNIVNTYCSVYSRILDDILYSNLTNLKNLQKCSEIYLNINRKIRNTQRENEIIINHIMGKNMDTCIKSLELTRKFYLDVITSYCNYFKLLKNPIYE